MNDDQDIITIDAEAGKCHARRDVTIERMPPVRIVIVKGTDLATVQKALADSFKIVGKFWKLVDEAGTDGVTFKV